MPASPGLVGPQQPAPGRGEEASIGPTALYVWTLTASLLGQRRAREQGEADTGEGSWTITLDTPAGTAPEPTATGDPPADATPEPTP